MFRVVKRKIWQSLFLIFAVLVIWPSTPIRAVETSPSSTYVPPSSDKFKAAYFSATASVANSDEKARLSFLWGKPKNIYDLYQYQEHPEMYEWYMNFYADNAGKNHHVHTQWHYTDINQKGINVEDEVYWGDHVKAILEIRYKRPDSNGNYPSFGQAILEFDLPALAPAAKTTTSEGDEAPTSVRGIPSWSYDNSFPEYYFKWCFKDGNCGKHDVKVTRPDNSVVDESANTWVKDSKPSKGKYKFETVGVAGSFTYLEINDLLLPGSRWEFIAEPGQGGGATNYNPAYFGVNWSTYSPEGKSKVNVAWGKPTNIDQFKPGGQPADVGLLKWVLNIYSPDSSISSAEHYGGADAGWYYDFDKDNIDLVDEVKWGKSYEAILDLRYGGTERNSLATADVIGRAKQKFTLPDSPVNFKSGKCEGDSHITDLEAMIESFSYDSNKHYIHFRWKYDPSSAWRNVKSQRPDGSVFDDHATDSTTDKLGQTGEYKFTILDDSGKEHGWCTVNITSLDTGSAGTGPAGKQPGDTAGTGSNECGVGVGANIFVQAIAGALCGLITLIGDFTAWIMEHIFGDVFNAYLTSKHLVFNYKWLFG